MKKVLLFLLFWDSFFAVAQETRVTTYPSHPQKEIPKISLEELHKQSVDFKGVTSQITVNSNFLPSGANPNPSPEASSAIRFKDIPVNFSTGSMSIPIPLYTLQEGSLAVPIALSFNGSGMKNEEVATWAGAGWNLTAGAMISRQVKGIPDEGRINNSTHYRGYHKYGLSAITPTTIHDTEPDIFYLNIDGSTTKFIYRWDGEKAKFESLPASDIIFEPTFTAVQGSSIVEKITKIDVTLPNGTKYVFAASESTAEFEAKFIQTSGNQPGTSTFTNLWKDNAQITSWYVTKIISPYNQQIDFEYDHVQYSFYKIAENGVDGALGVCPTPAQVEKQINRVFVSGASLSKVKGIKTKVEFNIRTRVCSMQYDPSSGDMVEVCEYQDLSAPRLDIDQFQRFPQNYSYAKRLSEMMVMENVTSPQDTLLYSFEYGYFVGDANQNYDLPSGYTLGDVGTTHKKRLRLEKINFPDKTNVRFRYRGDSPNFNGKSRLDFGIDHWGYANGATGNNVLTGLIPRDSDYPSCTPSTSNRESDPNFSFYGSMDSVIYSNRKAIAFEYEMHNALNYLDNSADYKPIGGSRVKSITTKDLISGIEVKKQYRYVDKTGISSGFLILKPTYRYQTLYNKTGSNSAIYDRLLGELGRPAVDYGRVEEMIINNQDTLGKTIYHFKQHKTQLKTRVTYTQNCQSIPEPPYYVCDTVVYLQPENFRSINSNHYNWTINPLAFGQLDRIEVFNQNSDTLQIKEFIYGFGTPNSVYASFASVFPVNTQMLGLFPNNSYYVQTAHYMPWYRLEKERTTIYSQNGTSPVISETSYLYKNATTQSFRNQLPGKHNQVSGILHKDAQQFDKQLFLIYPQDIDFGLDTVHHEQTCYDEYGPYDCSYDEYVEHVPTQGTEARGIFEFKNKNIWSLPIEEINQSRNVGYIYNSGNTYRSIGHFNNLPNFQYAPQKTFTNSNINELAVDGDGSPHPAGGWYLQYYRNLNDSIYRHYSYYLVNQTLDYNKFGFPIKNKQFGGTISENIFDNSDIIPIKGIYNTGGVVIDTTIQEYQKILFGVSKTIGTNHLSTQYEYDSLHYKGLLKRVFDKDNHLLSQVDLAEPSESFGVAGINDSLYAIRRLVRFPRTAALNIPSNLDEIDTQLTYSDGDGRVIQQIALRANPSKKDLLMGTNSYDNFGRPTQQILPIASSQNNGSIPNNILSTAQSFYKDNAPLSEIAQYEKSPLSRVFKTIGLGETFRPNKTQTQKTETGLFGINRYYFDGSVLTKAPYPSYNGNQIIKTTQIDEQGDSTISYHDKDGKLLEQHVQHKTNEYLKTTYVYDIHGRLQIIIPPILYNVIPNYTYLLFSSYINYVYFNKYDERGRLIETHTPEAGWNYTIYNRLGQVVMSQNARQRTTNLWLWVKYDQRGARVMSGTVSTSQTRLQIQSLFDGFQEDKQFEERDSNSSIYYTSRSFPSGIQSLLTVNDTKVINFYDDYNWNTNPNLQFQAYRSDKWNNSKGLMTGNKVRRLDTGAWLNTTFYYDDKNRLIQSHVENRFGGINQTDVVYDFIGQVLEGRSIYRRPHTNDIVHRTTYDYDHRGRKTQAISHLSGHGTEVLATYEYDDVGRVIKKNLNEARTDSIIRANENIPNRVTDIAKKYILLKPGTTILPDTNYLALIAGGLQNITYAYNISGNLRGVNLTPSGRLDSSKVFALKLDFFEDGRYFNGNLSKQSWKSLQDTATRSFAYTYDKAHRYTQATYTGKTNEKYDENVAYDANGNILNLNRFGWIATNSWQRIDSLSYQYPQYRNQLTGVIDLADDNIGFKEAPTGGTGTYTYYPDGSLKTDANKGITNIVYNHLDLPDEIQFGATKKIKNVYTADGAKIIQYLISGTDTLRTDYMGGLLYRNDTLVSLLHDEGKIRFDTLGKAHYQYFITDHLGNTRVIFEKLNDSLYIAQRADYYAFGGLMEGLSSTLNQDSWRFLMQGKEYVDAFGYNSYDFLTRQYDQYLGRMWQVDGANQFASGYVGMGNMPTIGIDPDGQFWHIVAGAVIGGGVNLWRNWDAVSKTKGGFWAKFAKGAAFVGLGALEGGFIAAAPGAGFAKIAVSAAGRAILSGTVKSVGNVILGGSPDQLNPSNILRDAAITGLTAGTVSGLISVVKGGNFWFGSGSAYGGDLTLGGVIDDVGNEIPSVMAGTVTKAPVQSVGKGLSQGLNLVDDVSPKLLPAPKTIARHHIFPQEFKPFFKKAGININNYTIEMEHFSTHLKGVHGNGLYNMPGKWNLRWEEFINANPNATAGQIFKFGEDLMAEYGFRFSRFVKYR